MLTLHTQMAQRGTQLQETQGQWSKELAGEIYSDTMRTVNTVNSHVQRVKSGQRELKHEYHDNPSMIDYDKQQKQVQAYNLKALASDRNVLMDKSSGILMAKAGNIEMAGPKLTWDNKSTQQLNTMGLSHSALQKLTKGDKGTFLNGRESEGGESEESDHESVGS